VVTDTGRAPFERPNPTSYLFATFGFGSSYAGLGHMRERRNTLRYLGCLLLLTVAPFCLAQEAKIRVINAANGRPLPKLAVFLSFLYDTKYDKEIPANYQASLNLETDDNGEAHFKFPQPPPAQFFAKVRVDWSHWDCVCLIVGSTGDLVRGGINGPLPAKDKKFAARYKAGPGEILFIFRPLSFFERLLYQLMKD
jgi:hypothetical protein